MHGHISVCIYICQHRRWLSNVRTWWQEKKLRSSIKERKNVSTILDRKVRSRTKGEGQWALFFYHRFLVQAQQIKDTVNRKRWEQNWVGHSSLSRCNVTLQLISNESTAMIVYTHNFTSFLSTRTKKEKLECDGRSTSLIGNNTHNRDTTHWWDVRYTVVVVVVIAQTFADSIISLALSCW